MRLPSWCPGVLASWRPWRRLLVICFPADLSDFLSLVLFDSCSFQFVRLLFMGFVGIAVYFCFASFCFVLFRFGLFCALITLYNFSHKFQPVAIYSWLESHMQTLAVSH